jgi:hypothetical protein
MTKDSELNGSKHSPNLPIHTFVLHMMSSTKLMKGIHIPNINIYRPKSNFLW